jgi:hypothetical protein
MSEQDKSISEEASRGKKTAKTGQLVANMCASWANSVVPELTASERTYLRRAAKRLRANARRWNALRDQLGALIDDQNRICQGLRMKAGAVARSAHHQDLVFSTHPLRLAAFENVWFENDLPREMPGDRAPAVAQLTMMLEETCERSPCSIPSFLAEHGLPELTSEESHVLAVFFAGKVVIASWSESARPADLLVSLAENFASCERDAVAAPELARRCTLELCLLTLRIMARLPEKFADEFRDVAGPVGDVRAALLTKAKGLLLQPQEALAVYREELAAYEQPEAS